MGVAYGSDTAVSQLNMHLLNLGAEAVDLGPQLWHDPFIGHGYIWVRSVHRNVSFKLSHRP
jgi:hypothetical protein